MLGWLKQLDELLRGDRVRAQDLAGGTINVSLRVFVTVSVVLGMIYGAFMGWYALGGRGLGEPDAWKQALASTIKLPALFMLTLGVTFPSLYVFNALVGVRLNFRTTLRLLVAAIAVNLAVGASLGPILGFFTVSTESYHFIVLLNVVLLGIAGMVGLGFLLKALRSSARVQAEKEAPPVEPEPPPVVRPDESEKETAWNAAARYAARLERSRQVVRDRESSAQWIFRVWVIIYGLVGAQMGWVLRPFIGAPGSPFAWLRPRDGSFFRSVWQAFSNLVGM